ncbi:hypothetical protein LINPERHAP1_LOCUS8248 [Linum perenne]
MKRRRTREGMGRNTCSQYKSEKMGWRMYQWMVILYKIHSFKHELISDLHQMRAIYCCVCLIW